MRLCSWARCQCASVSAEMPLWAWTADTARERSIFTVKNKRYSLAINGLGAAEGVGQISRVSAAVRIFFATCLLVFDSRDAVKRWIIERQFGRRNLMPFQRAELALKFKPMLAEDAKRRMLSGKLTLRALSPVGQGKTGQEKPWLFATGQSIGRRNP